MADDPPIDLATLLDRVAQLERKNALNERVLRSCAVMATGAAVTVSRIGRLLERSEAGADVRTAIEPLLQRLDLEVETLAKAVEARADAV